MKVHFLSPAEREFDDAIKYYEAELKGLGELFKNEIQRAILRIKEFPNAYPVLGTHVRRCLISKFPYGILYQHRESEGQLIIVAIAHLHRRPDYWKSHK